MLFKKNALSLVFVLFLTFQGGIVVYAEEAAPAQAQEDGEHTKKASPEEEKPRPDSAISTVMQLPEVVAWKKWIESRHNEMEVWGESMKTVDGYKCWSVAVAERYADSEDFKVYKRFCVMKTGLDILVETMSADLQEVRYLSYEKWKSSCEPAFNSPGNC